jgi:hypothetical protein
MAATLPIDSVWTHKTTRFFSSLPAWRCSRNLVSQSRSTPWLGESSLVAEALADARHCHKERLHDNQPEWMRGTRGAQQESEAPADGRRWHDERQCNNTARQETQEGCNERQRCNERQMRRQTGGGGVTRGNTTNGWGGREAIAPEKKRGTRRGRGATRSGQVEALLDGRQWCDEKLRWWRTEAT